MSFKEEIIKTLRSYDGEELDKDWVAEFIVKKIEKRIDEMIKQTLENTVENKSILTISSVAERRTLRKVKEILK